MREILFRGKCTDKVNWVYGGIVKFGKEGEEEVKIVPSSSSLLFANNVLQETVGQYTGLCDKNGKKIFIGDIVHYVYEPGNYWNANENAVIEETAVGPYMKGIWGTNKCALMEGYLTTIPLGDTDKPLKCMEVIGNIHDNPELLGEYENK